MVTVEDGSLGTMGSPQNKDGSEKTPLPHLLPVTVAKKTPRPDAVRRVSKWVLFNASVLAFSLAQVYALYLFFHVPCSQSQLTDAEDAVANALAIMMTCCIALAAPAAAVLALRLPCCRPWVRRALAYLALAFTIVGHGLMAHLLLVADPGHLFFRILSIVGIFVYAAGDIISFLVLLLGRED